MRTLPLLAAALAAACADDGPPCGAPPASTVEAGPGGGGNVLLVVIDDVGVDQLAAWGVGERTADTPTLDCLCDRGVRFTQAWAEPLCSPTRSDLMTGRYDRRTGIGNILSSDQTAYELPEREDTVAEVARRAGYHTGLVGKWHLASVELDDARSHPNRSGFDHFAGSLSNLANSTAHAGEELDYFKWEKVVDGSVGLSRQYATSDTVDEAIDFVRHAEGPWLLVVAFNAPHEPVHDPPGRLLDHHLDRHATTDDRYRAMLEATDHELSRLLRRMDPEVLADTTVAVIGDNGTSKFGTVAPFDVEHAKGTLYEGGVRVPLVVAGPHVPARGGVSDALVHAVDLLPTVADALGEPPEADLVDGRSLLPLLADPDGPPIHDTVASFLFGPVGAGVPDHVSAAIRDATHKLVVEADGTESLFEVGPESLEDGEDLLAAPPPREVAEIAGRLHDALLELEATFPTATTP